MWWSLNRYVKCLIQYLLVYTVIILETFMIYPKEFFRLSWMSFKTEFLFSKMAKIGFHLKIGWYPPGNSSKSMIQWFQKGHYLFISENHLPHCCILSDVQIKGSQLVALFSNNYKGNSRILASWNFPLKIFTTMCGWNLAFIFCFHSGNLYNSLAFGLGHITFQFLVLVFHLCNFLPMWKNQIP